jgi:hypothetical protein
LSQAALAELVNAEIYRATRRESVLTAKSISDWERGWYWWPRADVRAALCKALGVAEAADLGFEKPKRRGSGPSAADNSLLGLIARGRDAQVGDLEVLSVAGGRSFFGAELAVHHCVVEGSSREWVVAEPSVETIGELSRPDRRPVVVASSGDQQRYYVSDGRWFVGRSVRRPTRQLIPTAHVLDELTLALLWAITNTDQALLADDRNLEKYAARLARYEMQSSSAVTLSEVPELNVVSRRWLGSKFCSRHIMRHWDRLADGPLFWTREQRGEDAVSWLIWSHKFEYLRSTSRRFAGARRGFCIPVHEVESSPLYERVLMLLAAALMEAFEIRVEVTSEPEFGEVEGFVLADGAIVANWLNAPGVWYVDAEAPVSRWSTYRELSGQLASESIVGHPTAAGRLEALADYLGIPWGWLRNRCQELALVGVDGIVQPRSRLLSTDGLNTAIRYVAYLDRLETIGGQTLACG